MSFRRQTNGTVWHWCHNCSGWPRAEFTQREDKPVTWTNRESLCDECDARAHASGCQHSVELRTGLASDRVLGPVRY